MFIAFVVFRMLQGISNAFGCIFVRDSFHNSIYGLEKIVTRLRILQSLHYQSHFFVLE